MLGDILIQRFCPIIRGPGQGISGIPVETIQKGKAVAPLPPRWEIKTGLEKTIAYFMRKRKEAERR